MNGDSFNGNTEIYLRI